MYKKIVLLKLILLFIIATSIYIFNFTVDPYNFNKLFDFGLNKEKISSKKHYRLYKMNNFSQNPKNTIILGDSRSDALKDQYFNDLGQNNIFNLAYGGGTLYEALNTFWYATKFIQLNKVIIGIPFNIYNENNKRDLTTEAEQMLNNKLSSYINPFITKVSVMNIIDKLSPIKIERPNVNKEYFWKTQLGATTNSFYRYYKYPTGLFKKLEEVSSYCKTNNIELVFLIPPTHIDLQKKVDEYNLRTEYNKYKIQLKQFGKVLDFDTENNITINQDNFDDPYHFNKHIAKLLVRKLISQ